MGLICFAYQFQTLYKTEFRRPKFRFQSSLCINFERVLSVAVCPISQKHKRNYLTTAVHISHVVHDNTARTWCRRSSSGYLGWYLKDGQVVIMLSVGVLRGLPQVPLIMPDALPALGSFILYNTTQNIDVWTKWLTLSRQNIQMYFLSIFI